MRLFYYTTLSLCLVLLSFALTVAVVALDFDTEDFGSHKGPERLRVVPGVCGVREGVIRYIVVVWVESVWSTVRVACPVNEGSLSAQLRWMISFSGEDLPPVVPKVGVDNKIRSRKRTVLEVGGLQSWAS